MFSDDTIFLMYIKTYVKPLICLEGLRIVGFWAEIWTRLPSQSTGTFVDVTVATSNWMWFSGLRQRVFLWATTDVRKKLQPTSSGSSVSTGSPPENYAVLNPEDWNLNFHLCKSLNLYQVHWKSTPLFTRLHIDLSPQEGAQVGVLYSEEERREIIAIDFSTL
jgi:hypothetical protein